VKNNYQEFVNNYKRLYAEFSNQGYRIESRLLPWASQLLPGISDAGNTALQKLSVLPLYRLTVSMNAVTLNLNPRVTGFLIFYFSSLFLLSLRTEGSHFLNISWKLFLLILKNRQMSR